MRHAAIVSVAVMAGCIGAAASAQDQTVLFDVPAGPIDQSVRRVARTAQVSIGLPGRLPVRRVRAVRGRMSVMQALAVILDGSGLRAQRVGDTSYLISAGPPAVGAPRASSPADQRAPPAPTPAPAPTRAQSEPPAPDIIVVGAKRPLDLADLPLAVALIRPDDVITGGVTPGTIDIAAHVTAMTVADVGPGQRRLFLRGVADSPFNGPTQATVAVQFDEARITYTAPDPDLRLVDIDHVEILQGPQGPLYGTGALGGIYRIIARRPDAHRTAAFVAARAGVRAHGDASRGASVMLNLPIVHDRLALRLVAYDDREAGWVDSGPQRDRNRTHVSGARAALRWSPGAWTIDATLLSQAINARDTRYTYADGAVSRGAQLAEPSDNDFRHAALTVTGPLLGADFTAVSSWSDHQIDQRYDASSRAAAIGLTGPVAFDEARSFRILSQEIRLASRPGSAPGWLIGASALSSTSRARGDFSTGSASVQAMRANQQTRELALFGEAMVGIVDRVSVTAGARLYTNSINDEVLEATGAAVQRVASIGFSPSIAIAWSPPAGGIIFARIAQALRPGGLGDDGTGAVARFDADQIRTAELGWRASLLGERLALTASLYYSQWLHLQSDFLRADGLLATANVGNAAIPGVAVSWAWQMGDAWTWSGGVTLQQPRLREDLADRPLADRRLPAVSDISGWTELARAGHLDLLDWRVALTLRYDGPARLSFDPRYDYAFGNTLSVGLLASIVSGPWQLTARLDNILNNGEDSFAFGNPFTLLTRAQFVDPAPRALSISARYNW